MCTGILFKIHNGVPTSNETISVRAVKCYKRSILAGF